MTGSRAAAAVSPGPPAGVPIALWLLPCTDDAQWLQDVIRGLAQQHSGPVFEPHITLHVGEYRQGVDTERAIGEIAALWPSLNLVARATGESDAYYRSLYLEIADDRSDGAQLGRLRRQLVAALLDSGAAGFKITEPSGANCAGTCHEAPGGDKGPGTAADLDHALSCYDFRPHLSLLYGKLSQPLRAALARRNDFSGRGIRFDRLAAVRPAPGRTDLAEVADWEVFGHRRLTAVPGRGRERDL